MSRVQYNSAEAWLMTRIGACPTTSLGWFRAGVGFYNKREFNFAIECFQKSINLDPENYNAYQIMARACIAVHSTLLSDDALRCGACGSGCFMPPVHVIPPNRCLMTPLTASFPSSFAYLGRDDAIAALKQSVKLDNPSDWQLLIELTSQDNADSSASPSNNNTTRTTTTAPGTAMAGGSTSSSSTIFE